MLNYLRVLLAISALLPLMVLTSGCRGAGGSENHLTVPPVTLSGEAALDLPAFPGDDLSAGESRVVAADNYQHGKDAGLHRFDERKRLFFLF